MPWFSGLAILLELVETSGVWPQGLLDAFFAMIPEADGDSTPLGQRPLSVLPVVYRLWASLRLRHLREWVEGWLPGSVFSLGNGLSSVEAWFSTALDIEDVLSGTGGDELHVMVADVIKSFDTVHLSILDCALGRLGLLDIVMSVFGLILLLGLVNLVKSWWYSSGLSSEYDFSLLLFMYPGVVIWSRYQMSNLYSMLIISSAVLSVLVPYFESAHFTAQYVRPVGQDVFPW